MKKSENMREIIIIVGFIVLGGIMLLITFFWNDTTDFDTTLNHTRFEYEIMNLQHELDRQSATLRMYHYMCDKIFYESISELPTNCKNCGAPLKSHNCEYCGTKY